MKTSRNTKKHSWRNETSSSHFFFVQLDKNASLKFNKCSQSLILGELDWSWQHLKHVWLPTRSQKQLQDSSLKLWWVTAVSVREKDASRRHSRFQAKNIKPLSSFSLSWKEKYMWLEHERKCVEMDFTRRVVNTPSHGRRFNLLWRRQHEKWDESITVWSVQPACSACRSITLLHHRARPPPRAFSTVWTSCRMALNIPLDPDTSSPRTLSSSLHMWSHRTWRAEGSAQRCELC